MAKLTKGLALFLQAHPKRWEGDRHYCIVVEHLASSTLRLVDEGTWAMQQRLETNRNQSPAYGLRAIWEAKGDWKEQSPRQNPSNSKGAEHNATMGKDNTSNSLSSPSNSKATNASRNKASNEGRGSKGKV